MHRVYNSAFMHMLRDEHNQKYRQLIKNTLEFDPDILKRYVNFMNNPDEKTAIEQFGKDDKYFGICTLMVTMPGLPMFGHGQIEGYYEKYGMEYYRAYWDEEPDSYLIQRHHREIFPLLHRRYQFAGVEHFYLYDFYETDGTVNEDVFAYSNLHHDHGGGGNQRSLVVYHNRWADVRGWIKTSAGFKDKSRSDESLVQIELGKGLKLRDEEFRFTIFEDQVTGLEYIRSNKKIFDQGLYIELGAYKYQVFLNFREVIDNEWEQYAQIEDYLDGRGVPNIEEAMKELVLQPLHYPFKEIVNPGFYEWLIRNRSHSPQGSREDQELAITETAAKIKYFYMGIEGFTKEPIDIELMSSEITSKLEILLNLSHLLEKNPIPKSRKFKWASDLMIKGQDETTSLIDGKVFVWATLLSWLFTHSMGKIQKESGYEGLSRALIDEWLLDEIIANTLTAMELDAEIAWNVVQCVRVLVKQQTVPQVIKPKRNRTYPILKSWLQDEDLRLYLNINEYDGKLWFNKEAMEIFCQLMLTIGTVSILSLHEQEPREDLDEIAAREILDLYDVIRKIMKSIPESEFQVEKLLEIVK
jgi:hypothetical protein